MVLYDSCQHLFPSSQRGGGGRGATTLSFVLPTTIGSAVELYFPFDINTVLELCCSGAAPVQPSWPLSAWGWGQCVQHTSAVLHSWRTFARPLLVSSPLLPYSPGQLPIPFWDTMTLSFDSWGCFCCHWTFSPPSFSSTSLFLSLRLFLKVFNLGSKTGGVVELCAKWKPVEL